MAVRQPRYSKEGFEVDAIEIAACDRPSLLALTPTSVASVQEIASLLT